MSVRWPICSELEGPLHSWRVSSALGGDGYYLVAGDGGVFTFGSGAVFQGSTGGMSLAEPVVGMSGHPDLPDARTPGRPDDGSAALNSTSPALVLAGVLSRSTPLAESSRAHRRIITFAGQGTGDRRKLSSVGRRTTGLGPEFPDCRAH